MDYSDDIEILILTWNRLAFLKEALASVLEQTMAPRRIVIIDNASDDGTGEFAAAAAKENARVSHVRQSVHVDVCTNMATAIDNVRSRYFMMMHDDDILDRNCIAWLDALVKAEPDVALAYSAQKSFCRREECMDMNCRVLEYDMFASKADFVAADFARFLLRQETSLCFPAVLYRRDCVSAGVLQSQKFGKMLDRPFVYASAGTGGIVSLCTPLYHYRLHPGQDSGTSSNGPYPDEILNLLCLLRDILSVNTIYERAFRRLSIRMLKSLYFWGGNPQGRWRCFVKAARRLGLTNSVFTRPWRIPFWRSLSNRLCATLLSSALGNSRRRGLQADTLQQAGRQAHARGKVSVIVPVYNGMKLLPQTLESLKRQTYGDFECICIDDGSVDSSAETIEEVVRGDSRFKIVRQENKGVAAARNAGLKLASGRYATFLDQDDLLPSNALETLVATVERSGCDVVAGAIRSFSSQLSPEMETECTHPAIRVTSNALDDFFSSRPRCSGMVPVWAKMYSMDAIRGLSFPDGVYGADDFVFSSRVFGRIARFAWTDEPVYFYRMHPMSVTSQMPMLYIMGVLRSREIVWREVCANTAISRGMLRSISKSFAYDIMSWAIKKTCRKRYTGTEMLSLRNYLATLKRDGVLVPRRLKDRIKCNLFLFGRWRMLRLLFPKQFKRHQRICT